VVKRLRIDPDLLPGRIYDISYDICVSENANAQQSLHLFGGGGGNRTAGSSPDSDDSRRVSRTGIDENTAKEHEQNALPDILMTMSQIPDVTLELAEVGAMFSVFDALRGIASCPPVPQTLPHRTFSDRRGIWFDHARPCARFLASTAK
jgi:hypothetical protein